jgi:hypothetical protein
MFYSSFILQGLYFFDLVGILGYILRLTIFLLKTLCTARGMGASYRSNAYSPTALRKEATRRCYDLASFLNGVLSKLYHLYLLNSSIAIGSSYIRIFFI